MLPGPAGPTGPVGPTGKTGNAGEGVSRNAKLFGALLIALAVILGGANLLSGYLQYRHFEQQFTQAQAAAAAAQKAAGALVEKKLCTTFGELAALEPPPGNGASNPSRLYEQKQHDILSGVPADIGCRP